MSTTEQYVRQELAKDVAGCIQALDELKADLLQVNSDVIGEEQLTVIAEGIKKLNENLGRSRLVTIIAAALSGGKPE